MKNYVACGMMGDFIQSLYVVKRHCEQSKEKANVYITDNYGYGGDVWRFDINKTFNDLKDLISKQEYINIFVVLPKDFKEPLINLNDWRIAVATDHAETGGYLKCWTDVLCECYDIPYPRHGQTSHSWLDCIGDERTKGKVVVHRSKHRHNGGFNWAHYINSIKDKIIFLTTDINEWNIFPYKNQNIELLLVDTISEMASCIKSCKLFIGNQSAPFSLACALDVPRFVELDYDPSKFYMDEIHYTSNLGYYLNDQDSYFTYHHKDFFNFQKP